MVAHKPSYDFLNRIKDTSLRVQKKVLFRTHEIEEGPLHPPTEGPSSTNCYHPWADNTYSTFLAQSRTGITDPKSHSFRPNEGALEESSLLSGAGDPLFSTHPKSFFYQSLEFFLKPWVEGVHVGPYLIEVLKGGWFTFFFGFYS